MNNRTSITRSRIIADGILFFSVLYAPWWITAAAVFSCVIYFKNFYEAFFIGFLFDTLYGAKFTGIHGFRFFFSIFALLLLFAVQFVKEKIRM
jgi:hypothetical protein